MCWNSLSIVVYSVVFYALLDFQPSRVLADEPTYEGNTTVREGDPFKITCRVSMFQVIKWQKDGQTLVTDEHFNISEAVTSDNMFVSTITTNSASSMHSGAYRCTTQYNKFHVLNVVTATLSIKGNYDHYTDQYNVGEYRSKLVLNCNDDEAHGVKYTSKWFKDGNQITTDSEDPHHYDVSENTLVVNRFVESDVGEYKCEIRDSNNNVKAEKTVKIFLKPYMKLPKTATFIEGEKMELECVVYGVPTPEISWKFENKTLLPTEQIKFLPNKKNISNAILVLDPIKMEDRGNFFCIGKSNVSYPVTSGASYVRIKDKMAALWPFLGICAEVILLCLVIFIYEKKRNKAEFEESDTDQGPET
ncbi:neuroplastin isoform X2 [Melanaphis sacchari]|nr:neuroplastin isoform X2 [Melanaphis sacchari]